MEGLAEIDAPDFALAVSDSQKAEADLLRKQQAFERAKLMLEVSKAVAAVAGPERTGIRISPVTPANDVIDADPQPLFEHVLRELGPLGLAYVHVIEGATGGARDLADRPFDYAAARATWRAAGGQGKWMVNNGYDRALAEQALANGADLIAFGKPFISNPDLVRRLRENAAQAGLAPVAIDHVNAHRVACIVPAFNAAPTIASVLGPSATSAPNVRRSCKSCCKSSG